MRAPLRFIPLLLLAGLFWACGGDRALQVSLDRADALMEAHPDSALALLKPYDGTQIRSEAQRARFALLYSMALDKNYIDRKDFEVLQPALDYYPTHGTDADKIRTLYYAGCIFANMGNIESAMRSWAEGIRYASNSTDSLMWARLLVAQGNGYFQLYRIARYIENNQQAEKIYRSLHRNNDADRAMLRAFNGALSYNDSLANVYRQKSIALLADTTTRNGFEARNLALLYEIRYGSPDSVSEFIRNYSYAGLDSLDLVQAWIRLGNANKAMETFPAIQSDTTLFGGIKYNRTKARVLAANEDYKGAWNSFNSYLDLFDRHLSSGTIGDASYMEERVSWVNKDKRNRDSIMMMWIIGGLSIIVLLLIIALVYTRLQKTKAERHRVEEKMQKLLLTWENKYKNSVSKEIDLKKQIDILESEKSSLTELLDKHSISPELPQAIKNRLALFDSLIVKSMSEHLQADKRPVFSLHSITADTPDFLENSGKALEAIYPSKVSDLIGKGITYDELGLIYLYLLGLNGKEIGLLLNKKRSHYIKSSEIRKKLGLSKNGGNLGKIVEEIFEKNK